MDEDGYKAFQDRVTAKSKPVVYVLEKVDTSKVAAKVCRIVLFHFALTDCNVDEQ